MAAFAPMAIGAGISGISSLLGRGGGAGARNATTQAQGAQSNLNNVFNYAMPTSQGMTAEGRGTTAGGLQTAQAGINTMAQPLDYWKKIASGNRTATTQAMAPEINAAQQQTDAARRQTAQLGTARGGGVAAPNAEAKTAQMAQIDNALFSARGGANQQVGEIGKGITSAGFGISGIGQNEVTQAMNLLGLGSSAEGKVGDISTNLLYPQMAASQNTRQGVASGVNNVLSSQVMSKIFGGGGGYPGQQPTSFPG